MTSPRATPLLQLIRHFGDAGLAARLFLRPPIGCAAETDAADRLFADLDRNTTLQRNDLGKRSLTGNLGLGALRPLDGGAPERARRIGLALGQLDIVRRDPVAHDNGLQPPCTIDDSDRHPRRAFGPRRLCDRQRHACRQLLLHQHLRIDGTWNGKNGRHAGRGQYPKHHEILPTVVTLEFHLRPALRLRPMPGLCHGPHALVTGPTSAVFGDPWLERSPWHWWDSLFAGPVVLWHAPPHPQPAPPAATGAAHARSSR